MKNPAVCSKHNIIILQQSCQDLLLVPCAFDYTCSYKPPHYKATIFSTEQKYRQYLKFQQTQAPKIIKENNVSCSCNTARSWTKFEAYFESHWGFTREDHLCHGYHDVCNRKHSLKSTKHVFFSQLEASLIFHLQPAQLQTHITSGSIIHMDQKKLIKSYLWGIESLKKAKPKIITPRWQRAEIGLQNHHPKPSTRLQQRNIGKSVIFR